MDEKAHLPILKRVGIFLLVIGMIDLAAFIYALKNNIAYSSNFNIFAIAAGYFLFRGNLFTVVVVQWFSAFALTCVFTLVVTWSLLQPINLTLTYIRLDTGFSLMVAAFLALITGSFCWIYMQMASEPVQAARTAVGKKKRSMKIPVFIGGIFVSSVVFSMSYLMKHNPAIDQAKLLAAQQVQGNYKFHVKSLDVKKEKNANLMTAVVVAWNDNEIKNVTVKWQKELNKDEEKSLN